MAALSKKQTHLILRAIASLKQRSGSPFSTIVSAIRHRHHSVSTAFLSRLHKHLLHLVNQNLLVRTSYYSLTPFSPLHPSWPHAEDNTAHASTKRKSKKTQMTHASASNLLGRRSTAASRRTRISSREEEEEKKKNVGIKRSARSGNRRMTTLHRHGGPTKLFKHKPHRPQ